MFQNRQTGRGARSQPEGPMTEPLSARRPNVHSRLIRTRTATRAAVALERLWPLLLPLLIVASLFATTAWFGAFRSMPDIARMTLLGAFALASLGSLYVLRFFRAPTDAEIDRRIEARNSLTHTPLLAQTETPVGPQDAFSRALWREHQKRMAQRLDGVGGDMPHARIPERDPWGLRGVVALLLVVAFAFSFGSRGGSLSDAFRSADLVGGIPPRIDAWVTPPAYTGRPPIFLTAENNAGTLNFTVPTNSDVALRVTGGSGTETLSFVDADGLQRDIAAQGAQPAADGAAPAPPPPSGTTGASQFAGKLTTDGTLSLRDDGRLLNGWNFKVLPDTPPIIRFSGDPKRATNGTLELAYEVEDDYGAASAEAGFVLSEPQAPDARPLYDAPEMPLSVPRRGAREKGAKASRDLTQHVWAGSRVELTLTATDDAGQTGSTEPKKLVLPERTFVNPLAKSVVELRKILSLDANRKPYVLQLIDAITLRPEDTIKVPAHYLGIMAGRTRLKMAETDDQLREVADYLWEMALQIEDGSLSDAERRLQQAQQALRDALRDGASDEEIERLMAELREAMNEFLREFAERAARDPNLAQQQQPQGQEMRQSDLERMMDQIEELAKSGNRDAAEQLLSQLQEMMNNLQAQRQQQQQQQGQNGQQGEMREQMNKLGEIMRRQQEMMNETFQLDQQQRGQQQRGDQGQQGQEGQQGENGEQQQGGGMTPEEFAEAMRQLQEGQGGLQGDLEALLKGLEGMGIQPGEGFGEAGEAMGQAEGALGEGQGGRATGEQGRALEALRRGAQDMMQQMQQAQQGDEGGGQEGGRQQNADRDPLGRPRATTGPDFGDTVKVPDEIDVQRARQILDAIRRRLGNALSPELERDYLERLLEMR
jgi:uncharacterized protein (TIGR02302 family)